MAYPFLLGFVTRKKENDPKRNPLRTEMIRTMRTMHMPNNGLWVEKICFFFRNNEI